VPGDKTPPGGSDGLLDPTYPGRVTHETQRPTAGARDRAGNGAGDRLVRIGGTVFVVGAVATMATVAPLFLSAEPLPPAAYFVSMLMGAGFAIAAAGVLRSIAAQRRQAREAARSAG
jgi:hypothetical protein